ncbi:hypothetical protein [Devosia sp. 1566]|uniref:hypothetical protein n=1 Tax=Devosia sp. 1566 TaxID=2499144 RepID=UPI000FDB42D7|nr:hypothetical protein [Devosia sp. 1566]
MASSAIGKFGWSCLLVAALLGGCAPRPTGDFGRARPSYTHDVLLPEAGKVLADARDEPVSSFNLTDQETQMHNRVWRFLVAPHTKDWFFDYATELQRTRIAVDLDTRFDIDRYYNWLRRTEYQSSRVRYSTVGRHIEADLDTVPGTFLAICAVIEVDRQRAIAAATLSSVGAGERADVAARKAENTARIDWFVRALDYRFQSYNFALNQLLVETPHEQSVEVDAVLRRMADFVSRAKRRDFCGGAGALIVGRSQGTIPSRYQTQHIDREVVLPK